MFVCVLDNLQYFVNIVFGLRRLCAQHSSSSQCIHHLFSGVSFLADIFCFHCVPFVLTVDILVLCSGLRIFFLLLCPLLTSASSVCVFFYSQGYRFSRRIRQISPGKNATFPFIYLPHIPTTPIHFASQNTQGERIVSKDSEDRRLEGFEWINETDS